MIMVRRPKLGCRLPIVLLAGALVACAGVSGHAGRPAADDACALGAAGASRAAEPVDREGAERATHAIVVALPGPVDPAHAPAPRTEAERLVFSQLYETLVRVTCRGKVEPALARSWRSEENGRRWTFTLRSAVRDWHGRSVTAADVGSSWLAAGEALGAEPGAGPWPRVRRVGVRGPRTLLVELDGPATIAFFAHPALAVRTGTTPARWPIGTGPYLPPGEARPPPASDDRVLLPSASGGWPLELRVVSGDPRNALDAGADLLLTADPDAIHYAATSAAFRAVPLAWDRAYLLAARATGGARGANRVPAPAAVARPPRDALAALARDAVSAAARPALALAEALAACLQGSGGNAPATTPAARASAAARLSADGVRIVYPVADVAARSLAERLVALALDPGRVDAAWVEEAVPGLFAAGDRVRAAGLPAADFAAALRAGEESAYLIPVEHAGDDSCAAAEVLVARAPWLGRPSPGASGGPPSIVPLVETRRTLLLRRGVGGVVVDGLGTLRLDGVRRVEGAVR